MQQTIADYFKTQPVLKVQHFFLTHREINIAEFARSMGLNPTLLRNYINGFKKPSKEREQEIINHIHKLGKEMIAAWVIGTTSQRACPHVFPDRRV